MRVWGGMYTSYKGGGDYKGDVALLLASSYPIPLVFTFSIPREKIVDLMDL